jgi:hypothetical protein
MVFFDSKSSHLVIPESLNPKTIIAVFDREKIPNSTLVVNVINQGNKEASKVTISVKLPGRIISFDPKPKVMNNDYWVKVIDPKLNETKGKAELVLKNFYTTKPFSLTIGYLSASAESGLVEVFLGGAPATQVEDITEVAPWSEFDPFILPILVILSGVGIVLLILFFPPLLSALLKRLED